MGLWLTNNAASFAFMALCIFLALHASFRAQAGWAGVLCRHVTARQPPPRPLPPARTPGQNQSQEPSQSQSRSQSHIKRNQPGLPLEPEPEPEPARASQSQRRKRKQSQSWSQTRVRGQAAATQILTRKTRVPIPTLKQLDDARRFASEFEQQSWRDILRVPYITNNGARPPRGRRVG